MGMEMQMWKDVAEYVLELGRYGEIQGQGQVKYIMRILVKKERIWVDADVEGDSGINNVEV